MSSLHFGTKNEAVLDCKNNGTKDTVMSASKLIYLFLLIRELPSTYLCIQAGDLLTLTRKVIHILIAITVTTFKYTYYYGDSVPLTALKSSLQIFCLLLDPKTLPKEFVSILCFIF